MNRITVIIYKQPWWSVLGSSQGYRTILQPQQPGFIISGAQTDVRASAVED